MGMFGSLAPRRGGVSVQMMPWAPVGAAPAAPPASLEDDAADGGAKAPAPQLSGVPLGPLLTQVQTALGMNRVANPQAPGLAQMPPTLASQDPGPAGQVGYSPHSIALLLQQLRAQGLGAGGLSGLGG